MKHKNQNLERLSYFSNGPRVIALLSFIGSLIWFGMKPDYEPAVTSLAMLGTLITLFIRGIHKNKNKSKESKYLSNCDSLSGEIDFGIYEGNVYEVFYEQLFIRKPYLELKQLRRFTAFELIEQRPDGFKIKFSSTALSLKWKATGEFAKKIMR